MSVFFSRQCEYALRAVLYLASRPDGKRVSIREIAGALSIPTQFLAKIFQDLTRKKLLESRKGPNGGFRLRMPADRITLFHIVNAIDGVDLMENCIMGFPKCSGKKPCALHHRWARLRDALYESLVERSVESFVREAAAKNARRA